MSFYLEYHARAFSTPYKAKIEFFTADRNTLKQVEGIDDKWADYIIRIRQYGWSWQKTRDICESCPDSLQIDWDSFDWSTISPRIESHYPHFQTSSPNHQTSQTVSEKNQHRSGTPNHTELVEPNSFTEHDLHICHTPHSRRASMRIPNPDTVSEPNCYWGQSLHSQGAPYSVESVDMHKTIPHVPSTLLYDGTTSWEVFQT